MKVKHPYTKLDCVVLPCFEMAADFIHGHKNS